MEQTQISQTILYIIIILLFAKVLGELAERIGQPPVLGELIAGVILGGSVLGWIEPNGAILFLAELGAILLLFEVGLESDIEEFLRVGPSAFMVATIGVIGPFTVGYIVSLALGLSNTVAIFIGATLTATSVGITARTFSELGQLRTAEAKIVLGAAVIDDVMGLVILAVVSGLVKNGCVSAWDIGKTTILAIAFLVGAIMIGIRVAPYLMTIIKKLRTRGVLTITAFLFCLLLAYGANQLHLAAIVGAFAAGLVLAKTEDIAHIEARIKPLADVFIPIFFVQLGLMVNLSVLNPFNQQSRENLLIMVVLVLVAIVMKILSGLGVLRRKVNRLIVGVGMIPRGEVGLIFASIGFAHKIITPGEYSAIIAIVVITTFVTPPLLKLLLKIEQKTAVPTE